MKHRLKLKFGLMACSAVLSLADFANGDVYFREGPTFVQGVGGYTGGEDFRFLQTGEVIYVGVKKISNGSSRGRRIIKLGQNGELVEFPGLLPPNDSQYIRFTNVNNVGTVVGFAEAATTSSGYPDWRAMRWDINGIATELGGLQPAPDGSGKSFSSDINQASVAVGYAESYHAGEDNYYAQPFRWHADTNAAERLPTLGTTSNGVSEGDAHAINNTGLIGGASLWISPSGIARGPAPVLWDNSGNLTLLNAIGSDDDGYGGGYVYNVNEAGSAFGEAKDYIDGSGNNRPVRWPPNTTTPIEYKLLDVSQVSQTIVAGGLNESDYAIGTLARFDLGPVPKYRAVRWDPDGNVTELPVSGNTTSSYQSEPFSMNNLEIVAGYYREGTKRIACVWLADSTRIDLNTITALPDGWSNLLVASNVHDAGWVGGFGRFDPDGSGSIAPYDRAFMLLVPQFGTYGLGDANFDTHVDFADLLIVAQNYGEENDPVATDVGDFDLDGDVDFNDLLTIAQNYGQLGLTLNESSQIDSSFTMEWDRALASVPEPGSLMLLSVGMLIVRRRR